VAPSATRGAWTKAGLAAVALVALVFAGREVAGEIPRFAAWVDSLGVWGPVAFMTGYALAAVLLIPGSWLTLAAGALFGVAWGTLYVMAGATAGAALAFLIGRYLARGLIERRLAADPRFAAVDRAIGAEGARIVLLLRLTPFVPYTFLNYALGATRVRFTHYVAGSIGMLPATVLYAYTGRLAGDLAAVATGGGVTPRGPGYYTVLALGLAATLAVTVVLTRLARRALRGVIE
jgi:uncharacterized membrane protein YdjX (TVP38/TMEM64 family)